MSCSGLVVIYVVIDKTSKMSYIMLLVSIIFEFTKYHLLPTESDGRAVYCLGVQVFL